MMQHNEQSNPGWFRKFFRDRGYYIVLALCVCAVGVSGYLFISGAIAEKNALSEPAMSVATPAEIPDKPAASRPSAAQTQQTDSAAEEAAAQPSGDEAVYEQASRVRVWPISGEEQAGYSMEQLAFNETTRDWRTHDGVDLASAEGAPVRAACAGTVTAVFDDELYGTTVVIGHADGYTTHYQNLAAMPTVSAGDHVKAGDVIGAVGRTALLEVGQEPHLHFAVHCNGQPVDPAAFVD